MQFKHTLFKRLTPITRHYNLFMILAIAQLIGTVALPLIWSDLDTAKWMLSLALFAFWLSNYALLRMAFHYDPERKGLFGWINGMWENLLVISWGLLLISVVFLIVKLALEIW